MSVLVAIVVAAGYVAKRRTPPPAPAPLDQSSEPATAPTAPALERGRPARAVVTDAGICDLAWLMRFAREHRGVDQVVALPEVQTVIEASGPSRVVPCRASESNAQCDNRALDEAGIAPGEARRLAAVEIEGESQGGLCSVLADGGTAMVALDAGRTCVRRAVVTPRQSVERAVPPSVSYRWRTTAGAPVDEPGLIARELVGTAAYLDTVDFERDGQRVILRCH